ncbi:MAG: helix-turn-helix domain-containing protein, partial [Planctomycetaceae bacterium]|nr:helix-turn-helix domain-containing protein [Planctomycetaceae bacterium]
RSTPARLVLRAKIVLAAAEGRENKDIAAELGCTRRTVGEWRIRFAEFRLEGIERDAPRGGRTPEVRARFEAEILRMTAQETPPNATQWSTRSLAKALGCNDTLVQRVWKDNGLQPHRTKSFKVSNESDCARFNSSHRAGFPLRLTASRITLLVAKEMPAPGGPNNAIDNGRGDSDCRR